MALKLPKLGDIVDVIKLLPQVLALINAIKVAASDKHVSAEEVSSLGAALVDLIVAVVSVVSPGARVDAPAPA